MRYKVVAFSSFKSLRNNPVRTGLTMLGIIIGISAVIIISSLGQGAVAFITNELSVFGSSNFRIAPGQNSFTQVAQTANPLTTKDADAISNSHLSNIKLVAPLGFANATVTTPDEKTRTTIRGMPSQVEQILEPKIIYGEFISETNDNNREKVAVLGLELSQELFGQDTNPVGESIRVDNIRYRIIGVTQASSAISANLFDNNVIVPISSLITHITGKDELFQIVIRVENENLLKQTVTDVEEFLREYRDIKPDEDADFFTQSFDETLTTIQTVTGLLTAMITGISGISLLVGGIGVMNIMLVTVTERTKEIGLLKAIGARDQDILAQFLFESITLSVVGGIIGITLGVIGAFTASLAANIPFVISPLSIIIAVSVSTLVGIVFGLYPARRAAQLNPIDALRYE